MHSSYYRGCWHELSPCFLRGSVKHRGVPPCTSSPPTAVYNPKTFIPHAASLGQTCVHCRRFSTAATRRCLASVSVPVVGAMLSHPLSVKALVSRYLTNKLILRKPLPRWNHTHCFPFHNDWEVYRVLPTVSRGYPQPEGTSPTRYYPVCRCPPLRGSRSTCMPNPRRQRSF